MRKKERGSGAIIIVDRVKQWIRKDGAADWRRDSVKHYHVPRVCFTVKHTRGTNTMRNFSRPLVLKLS